MGGVGKRIWQGLKGKGKINVIMVKLKSIFKKTQGKEIQLYTLFWEALLLLGVSLFSSFSFFFNFSFFSFFYNHHQ